MDTAALRPGHAAVVPWPKTLSAPADGALDLWLLHVPDPWLAGAVLDTSPLDERERTRAASFVHAVDRAKYVASHLMLRRLLGAYLDRPAGEVAFVREPCPCCGAPHGRPALAGDGPHFSLSHGGNLVLVGVAAAPVGVDTEQLPAAHTVGQVATALHPDEQREVMSAPAVRRAAVFTRLWVRKEAYLKGLGTGLGRSPALDYLGNGGPGTPAWPAGWTIVDVPVGAGHAAAAVRGPIGSRYDVARLDPQELAA
ncbi:MULTISPECIES: 4'-phosphopantetheinyl transferase superfamily protein [Streptomyces]|uniref:4'-phosphopantetheinyl transferase domain-containing protein n=1 Tax=Streptomyces luteosporeus TaxID=173856 RepID=A0ABP6GKB9_9ACTN